jgi:tetratricopeptide (TPR) repeat protein
LAAYPFSVPYINFGGARLYLTFQAHLNHSMVAETESVKIATRRLILRDSASFAILLFGTAVLFAVTLFLFQSFATRRAQLAQDWSSIGTNDLKTHNPDAAVSALRTALIYAPGTRDYELLLAQALGESACSGCREESYNYYMSLWGAAPGDGSINLALARLDAQRKNRQSAINYYRAAIYGTWEGNGVDRRANVRLELANYMIGAQDFTGARLELLIAGTNAPESFDRSMAIASMLQQARYPTDAWTYYQKAIADKPADPTALDAAGLLAYKSGDFEDAHRLLARALANEHGVKLDPQTAQTMENAQRITELDPSISLPPRERTDRILAARSIAKKRFDNCSAQIAANPDRPADIDTLSPRWMEAPGTANSPALLLDPDLQQEAVQLIFDTETEAEGICAPATGDDALLLTLATSPHNLLAAAERTPSFVEPSD